MLRNSGRRTAGIILAAGASSRMGKTKQLLDLGGITLLDHILEESLDSGLDFVVLVLGYHSGEILRELKTDVNNPRLSIVENAAWKQGISSSIIAGLREARDRCDHCMIIHADMPFTTTETINDLLSVYLASGLRLGSLQKGNRRSLPVIFRQDLFDELFMLKGDLGARDLFRKYSGYVCLVDAGPDFHDADIDTPEDYRELMKLLERAADTEI